MKKILVVDNNRTIVELLSALLEKTGYTAIKAYDGMEALDRLEESLPDVIVLDLIMPKIDGYRLSKYLKSEPKYRHIPIIILTGIAAEDSDQIWDVDADAFIAKGKIDDTFTHLMTTIRWLEARKTPNREIQGMDGIFPREMTKELLLVKQHFDSMLQVMGEGVLEMDERNRILFANHAACQLLARDEVQIFGRNVTEIFPDVQNLPDYLAQLPKLKKAVKPAIQVSQEGRVISLLGTPFFFNGAYIGSIAVLEDITAQVKKEAALEELTETIIQSAPIGIAVINGAHQVMVCNDRFKILSLARGEIVGRLFADLPAFRAQPFADLVTAATASGEHPVSREVTFSVGAGKRLKTYSVTGNPLIRQNGQPYLLLLVDDVTEKSLLQEELVAANRELEIANQAKSNFLSIVSHELRTPLSVIRGYISLIIEGRIQGCSGEALEALTTSDKRARHLQHLIEELLDLSRIEAGKITLREDIIVAEKHIRETLDMFSADIERKQIKVRLDFPAALPQIVADHDKIHQIFTNLIGNAIKFTPDGGSLTVTALPAEGGLSVAVADSGIGIAEDKIPMIFNKFYQVDSTNTRLHSGTGLGLSIIKMILDAMHGSIAVSSTPGQGSTFTVFLPSGPADKLAAAAAGKVPATNPATHEKVGVRTLLLCEDDPDTVRIVSYTLPKDEFEVVVCPDCFEGLRQVYARRIDLALIDVRLPLMSGYDFCRMLRANEATRKIPIIILSAASQEDDIKRGFEAGADEYLLKPFSPKDLLEKLHHRVQYGSQE